LRDHRRALGRNPQRLIQPKEILHVPTLGLHRHCLGGNKGATVHGYIAQSGLPRLLVNLVYLRVSQINGCAYCIDMHSRDLINQGLAVEKLLQR
jgi:AhpD family alkylhydroperoxidase